MHLDAYILYRSMQTREHHLGHNAALVHSNLLH